MSDFLSYVERNYGCVAEYNRCREEEEQYEYEKQEKARAYYQKNKIEYDKAEEEGKLVRFCVSCYECSSYTDIGMTDDMDDVPHGRCDNLACKDCEYRIKEAKWKAECERKEAENKAMLKRAYTDTKTKANNECLSKILRKRANYLDSNNYNFYDRLKSIINMYLESEENEQLKITETLSLILGVSVEEIAKQMLTAND